MTVLTQPMRRVILHLYAINLWHSLSLYSLIALSYTAISPVSSIYRLVLETVMQLGLSLIIAYLWVTFVDFWAQWRGYYTQLKRLFHATGAAVLPLALVLPLSLLESLFMMPVIMLWVAYRMYRTVTQLYTRV